MTENSSDIFKCIQATEWDHDEQVIADQGLGSSAEIEEDEDPLHLLVSDYEHWL